MQDERRLTVRLPGPIADWLLSTKESEGRTVNFEIIRSVRERMDRMKAAVGEKLPGTNPTAGTHDTGFPAGPATHG